MRCALLTLMLTLTACGSLSPIQSISPSALLSEDKSLIADHRVFFSKNGQDYSLLTHLEISPNNLSFIGFGALGDVLFECIYKQEEIQCDARMDKIPSTLLFNDMQLIYWPLEAVIASMKSSEFTLSESAQRRILYYKGNLFSEIYYTDNEHWKADIFLDHYYHDYQLHIHPLRVQHGGQYE